MSSELMVQAMEINKFSKLLDARALTTCYRPLWLDGILEEVLLGKREIALRALICRMMSRIWYPVIHCKLSLGKNDGLSGLMKHIQSYYPMKTDEKSEVIYQKLLQIDDKDILKQISNLCSTIPYRLLTAFYEVKPEESLKKSIIEQANQDVDAFYHFDTAQKMIIVTERWVQYLKDNAEIVSAWIEHGLIYVLQKKNPNVPAIPFKIAPPDKRDLGMPTKLWKYFMEKKGVYDLYINKPITQENMAVYGGLSIDHFMPWSFVLHDEIWNLTPSFKNINSSKNNDLPDLAVYLDEFCDLQYQLFRFLVQEAHEEKYKDLIKEAMEEYVHIMPEDWDDTKENYAIGEEQFKNCIERTIRPLYQIAYNSGYPVWQCEERVEKK